MKFFLQAVLRRGTRKVTSVPCLGPHTEHELACTRLKRDDHRPGAGVLCNVVERHQFPADRGHGLLLETRVDRFALQR